MLKELRHKHIIGLFGTVYGEHSGILMEFAANGSLDRSIALPVVTGCDAEFV